MKPFRELLDFEIFRIGEYTLKTGNIAAVVLVIVLTVFLLWATRKILFRKRIRDKLDDGNLYALFQILRYVAWIIAILISMEALGLKLNVLLAGSAALLVGVGLGLQNTFNNFIAGLILLFEGSIKVGDILEIDGDVVKIERIGLRTSSAINRDDIVILIPNSLITSNKVINWSHQEEKTRFKVKVGVAYGSDVEMVMKSLRESAYEHPEITDKDAMIVRFIDFGNSSLDFEVLFYSQNIFRIENVKSEIRRNINRKFIENGVTIPFPQVDVHFKSDPQKIFKGSDRD